MEFFANIVVLSAIGFRLWLRFSNDATNSHWQLWKWLVHPTAWIAAVAASKPGMPVMLILVFGICAWGIFRLVANYFSRGGGTADAHRRGQRVLSAKDIKRWTKHEQCRAQLGEVDVPRNFEVLHFLIAGTTGSGKTLAFHQLMQSARCSDAAIVADVGGTFTSRYFQVGDVILNPLDERCPPWSPLAEIFH